MRNGLNITGVSEMVHEIRENPEEAVADFAVACPAEANGAGTVEIKALTARNGTVRMARDFHLRQRPFSSPPDSGNADGAPTPYESALASLGACVLITQINGFTARGVTLGGIRLTVSAELPLDAAGQPVSGAALSNVRWRCDVDCDAPTDTIRSINRLVTAFSPNHRVFLDEASIDVITIVRRTTGEIETFPVRWEPESATAPATSCPVEAEVVWDYGSEAVYRTALTVNGTRQETGPLIVDQAKQMLGIDKGPNSQEILLSALCGELTPLISQEAESRGVTLHDPRLRASGRLDTRGMLNVLREAPSRFHNLLIELTVLSDAPRDDLHAVLRAALSRAALPATLRRDRVMAVELWHNGSQELAYDSTTEDAEALRDELTRRQREALSATG
jgi:uncharacterized OsmC-like protein